MNSNPLISIIIPVYNTEKYIYKAVNSILNQSYSNLEIWLCDDASTDNSREILKSFKDNRIKTYFLDKNTKKIGIVNEVLSKVTGDYIAFQDADDWSEPTRLEKQLKTLMSANDLGIIFTKATITHTLGDPPTIIEIPVTDSEIKKFFYEYGKFRTDKNIACPTMLVKREIITQIGGYHNYFKGKAGSDIFMTYQMLKLTDAYCLEEPLYHHLRTEDSFTEQLHSLKNIKSAYIWKVISKLIEYDQNNIDLLNTKNELLLKEIELECCEMAFKENVDRLNNQIKQVRSSNSYRLGNLMVKPFSYIKNFNAK